MRILNTGTKVILKNHPHKVEGTVINSAPSLDAMGMPYIDQYLVEYTDKTLIPPKGWHDLAALEVTDVLLGSTIVPQNITTQKKVECCCGVDACGGGKHSDWCHKTGE